MKRRGEEKRKKYSGRKKREEVMPIRYHLELSPSRLIKIVKNKIKMRSSGSSFLACLILFIALPACLGSAENCISGINSLLTNITALIFQNQTARLMELPLIAFSGKGLNKLGSYELCRSTPNTSYITLYISRQGVPAAGTVLGVCGPANCTAADYQNKTVQDTIQSMLAMVTPFTGVNISSLLANVTITPADPNSYPAVTASSWVGFFVVGIPIFLTLIASGIRFIKDQKAKAASGQLEQDSYIELEEGEKKARSSNLLLRLLGCWAIQDTLKQLFYPQVNSKHDSNLHIFNGVRFFSILWVLLGHQYANRITYTSNYGDLHLILDDKFLNVIAAGYFSVDTFLFLSGFFAAFVLHSKLKAMKVGVITYGSVVLHRIVRIWPVYIFLIMLYWKISVYFGSGPIWGTYVNMANGCDRDWWKSMLFIESWFANANCASWGWYLSCDMQMFLISPIIIWLYLKRKSAGLTCISVLLFGSLSLGLYYAFADNVYAGATYAQEEAWYVDIYKNPLVRVPPYLVGTALALIYRSTKEAKSQAAFEKIKNSKLASWIVELSGVALISLLVWLPAQVQNNPSNWSPWFHHVFMALNRFLFSIGLLLIVLPTLAGSKTVIRWILSAGFWTPLATLTFATYLIHVVVLLNYVYSEKSTYYFSHLNVLWEMVPFVLMSLFGALIIHLVIEAPVGKIETTIRGSSSRAAKTDRPTAIKDISELATTEDGTRL